MLQKKISNIGIGLAFCLILIIGFLLVEFKLSSHLESKTLKFIQVILIALMGVSVQRMVNLSLTTSSMDDEIRNIKSSSFLIHFINLSIIVGTLLAIFLFGLKQNFSNIVTASGVISASILFSLKSIVMDAVSGFILDTDHRFKIGDWIQSVKEEHRGQIVKINWRTTVLQNEYGYFYHIPNGNLVMHGFTFIPQHCCDVLTLKIHRDIPFNRVNCILMSALTMRPETRHQSNLVIARDLEDDMIVYDVRFGIESYDQREQIRHNVLQLLAHYLSFYDFNHREVETKPSEKILKMTDIFQPLSVEVLQKLSTSLTQKIFTKGSNIVQQGDPGSSMYLIYEGVAKVIAQQHEPRDHLVDVEIAILGPGQFFGDIALLMGKPRTATVQALSDMVVYEIKKEDIQPIFLEHPHLVEILSQIIAERLNDKDHILENQSTLKEELSEKKIILGEIKNFFGL